MNGQYGLVAVKTILRTAILLSSLSNANAMIPGVLLPHGDFAWDPTLLVDPYYRHVADQVALGSRQAAAAFANMTLELQINTFVLLTPHGDVSLDYDFGIYIADSASGSCIIGQDLIPPMTKYNLSLSHLSLYRNHSQDLLEFLQRQNQSVAGIYPSKKKSATGSTNTTRAPLSSSSSSELSLNWAEIIPLSLLQPFLVQPHYYYQFIILSMPRRRYQHAAEMVPELLHLGNLMGQWIQQLSSTTAKVGVVISGDLSHTHQAAGPYGYSWTSAPFDHALGQWAHHPLSQESQLVTVAKNWQSQARSCGFAGLVLWQGILKSQQAPAAGCHQSYPGDCDTKTDTKRRRTTRMTTTTTTTSLLRNNGPPPTNIDASNNSTTKEGASPFVQLTRHLRRQSKEVKLHHDGSSSSSLSKEPCLYSKVYVNRNVTYYGMMAATFWWE